MNRLVAHTRAIFALLLASVLILTAQTAPTFAQESSSSASSSFTLLWRKPVPPLREVAITPQGTRLAMLTPDGKLAVWDAQSATPLWSKPFVTATDIRISDGAGYVFAYRTMDPLGRTIAIYRADKGDLVANSRLDSAVWSVAVSDTGDFMAAGTSKGSVYLYTLDVEPSIHRFSVRGLCNGLDFAPDGSYLVTGLWNQSGTDCFDTTGNSLWSTLGRTTRRFEPLVTRDSRFVLTEDYDNHLRSNPSLTLISKAGKPLWTYDIGPNTANVRAISSRDGRFTVASYYRDVVRDQTWVPVRRLILLDSKGHKQFSEIGGPYLSLTLMAITPDNNGFIAYDGDRKLYRFDSSGNALETLPLTSPIRAWSITADGHLLLIHTTDEELSLLAVS